HFPRRQILPDQPGHLGSTQACCLCDVASQQPLPRFPLHVILLIGRRLPHPVVDLLPIPAFKSNLLACCHERPDLLQVHGSFLLHADDQPPACPVVPSGSSCIGTT